MLSEYKRLKRSCRLLLMNIFDSTLYFIVKYRNINSYPQRIVFVCKGNICRSAFAEYLMKAQVKNKLLKIESCGLDADMKTPVPLEARSTAVKLGINLNGHISRGWESCNLESSDLILAMEFWQYKKLVELFPNKKSSIKLLRDYAPFPENLLCNINDPFGQSEEMFEKCFKQIERSIANFTGSID